jgi:GNAT superfamily N-acetyltransferase
MSDDIKLREATMDEAPIMGRLIADAFHELDISKWLVPDPRLRRKILPAHFGLFTEHAIRYGTVYTTVDFTGMAAWLPSRGVPQIPDFDVRNHAICGDRTPYFDALGSAFDSTHPHDRQHYYLEFLAVDPTTQGSGLGSALLETRHRMAERNHMPCYLEAADRRSRRLYLRHGYTDHGEPLRAAPGSPPLYPMWRQPSR